MPDLDAWGFGAFPIGYQHYRDSQVRGTGLQDLDAVMLLWKSQISCLWDG